ncbi:Transposase and inactivated derivatives [Streptococcus pneumoniae]|nr:Transposase and inactivated derivatives [Streptococcus pneumoniae]
MEQLHFITKLLDIKDPNIKILDIINMDTHKEIIAKLDYEAPSCPDCGSLMKKYDFQKPSKIPYLETTGMPSRILLRKRRFKCYHCSKMMVAETPLVKKNHQIPRIINQKIAQKLIEKISMTDIAHQLAISTSTVIRKLNDFHFELQKTDFYRPEYQKRKDEICPFSSLAFLQPTTVDKEPLFAVSSFFQNLCNLGRQQVDSHGIANPFRNDDISITLS